MDPVRPALLALLGAFLFAAPAVAAEPTIGVSWSNFQEERWKTDEAALRSALEAAGARYLSADAAQRAEKQLADVESRGGFQKAKTASRAEHLERHADARRGRLHAPGDGKRLARRRRGGAHPAQPRPPFSFGKRRVLGRCRSGNGARAASGASAESSSSGSGGGATTSSLHHPLSTPNASASSAPSPPVTITTVASAHAPSEANPYAKCVAWQVPKSSPEASARVSPSGNSSHVDAAAAAAAAETSP